MFILHAIIIIIFFYASGQAMEKIFFKAGFTHTPKFIFWIPGLNLVLILYLAIYEWPNMKGK